MERVRNGLAKFVVRHFGATRASVRLYVEPFRGGLESVQVAHIHAEYRDRHNQPRGADFVMKVAERQRERESAAYRLLLPQDAGALAPKLLGIEAAQAGRVHLYLEWIKPWRALALAGCRVDRKSDGAFGRGPRDFFAVVVSVPALSVALEL